MKAIKVPVPWVVTAQKATAVLLMLRLNEVFCAAPMRFEAKGAVKRRG